MAIRVVPPIKNRKIDLICIEFSLAHSKYVAADNGACMEAKHYAAEALESANGSMDKLRTMCMRGEMCAVANRVQYLNSFSIAELEQLRDETLVIIAGSKTKQLNFFHL